MGKNMTTDDELLDDKNLKTNHKSNKEIRIPQVNKSQYNLQFQHPLYQMAVTKGYQTKTHNKIHAQMQNRRNMQLGKPMSTRDYFSQNEQMNGGNIYYTKKPILMELGSSKNTRPTNPTNKENSMTNPQSTFKLDCKAVPNKDVKDICSLSPDQTFGTDMNHYNHIQNV